MSENVSGRALAARLGVSENAIRKATKRGLLIKERSSGLYDVEKAKRAWEMRDPDAAMKGIAGGQAVAKNPITGAPPESSLTRARTVQAALKAEREKLALQRARGEVISKADALAACRAVVSIVLERLDGAAAQIGPRIVGLDAPAAERVAREVLHTIRAEIAGTTNAVTEISDAA